MAQQKTPLIILRRRDVEARTGLPRSTMYALMKQGKFPKQVSLGERAVGWVQSEIEEWIEQHISQSRKPGATHHG